MLPVRREDPRVKQRLNMFHPDNNPPTLITSLSEQKQIDDRYPDE